MHNKNNFFISAMNFVENTNNRKIDILQNARVIAHRIANKGLEIDKPFSDMPFDKINGMEYYGCFDVVEIKKVDELILKEEEDIVKFYADIYGLMALKAINTYA